MNYFLLLMKDYVHRTIFDWDEYILYFGQIQLLELWQPLSPEKTTGEGESLHHLAPLSRCHQNTPLRDIIVEWYFYKEYILKESVLRDATYYVSNESVPWDFGDTHPCWDVSAIRGCMYSQRIYSFWFKERDSDFPNASMLTSNRSLLIDNDNISQWASFNPNK